MSNEICADMRTDCGSAKSGRMRQLGTLPAVLYGKGIENINISVSERDIEKLLKSTLGMNTFINLKIKGQKDYTVLIKDYQGHALSRRVTHVDFWHVDGAQEVAVDVKTRIEGKAPGLLQGGILEHTSHTVKLICRADSILAELVIDVSALEVGKSIHLAQVTLPQGVKCRENYNPTIVSIVQEKAQPVADAAATTEAVATDAAKPVDAKAGDAKAVAPAAAGKAPSAGKAPAKPDAKKK